MAKKVELVFDLDTREVKGESSGFEGTTCDLDLGVILAGMGEGVKRKRKDRTQLRDTREKATK